MAIPVLSVRALRGGGGGGGGETKTYEHYQSTPSDTWTITHNLNKKAVTITAFNTNDDEIIGCIECVNVNTIKILFNSAVAGKAFIS